MAQITVVIFGILSASVPIQSMFHPLRTLHVHLKSTLSANASYSFNKLVPSQFQLDLGIITDPFKQMKVENKAFQDAPSIWDYSINVFGTMILIEEYVAGINKSYDNLAIQHSVLCGYVRHMKLLIDSSTSKSEHINAIVIGLYRKISVNISTQSRNDEQRGMDCLSRQRKKILTIIQDFSELAWILFGLLQITVLIVTCKGKFNGAILQQKGNVYKVHGDCLYCNDSVLCFLEISLPGKEKRNDDCKYKELSGSIMKGLKVKYCHVSITCRQDLYIIPRHRTYLLFVELTARGGILETSYDLSDFRRSVLKCLMGRSENVFIVALNHTKSEQLPKGAMFSPELKCIKGDHILEELKGKNCLLSMKDTLSNEQISHIKSALPSK